MDASKLEQLATMTGETDGEAGPTSEQVEQQTAEQLAETQAREWGVIVYTIGNGLSMMAPELRAIYTEDACLNWGRSMVPVAEKYGWNGPSNVPELGLLIATAGLGVPTFLIVRAKLDQMREARRLAEAQAKAQADAQTVENAAGGATDGGAP